MIAIKKLDAVSKIMPLLLISTVGIGLTNVQPAHANFTVTGGKTASWKEPSKITIYIPGGLMGNDRMNFEMGINSWVNMLPKITVMFMDGMHPNNITKDFIDVKLVDMLPPNCGDGELGCTVTQAFNPPPGQNHGMMTSATISILNGALGKPTLLKNLGAHEFGHALGLADDPRTSGDRVNVMDPNFDSPDPFIAPTARDKMMAKEHYTVTPEPSAIIGLGLIAGLGIFSLKKKETK